MRRALILVLAAGAVATGGCARRYSMSGGGLPTTIKTVAVLPFDNQTATPELQREINEELRRSMASRLGLHEASEDKASAIVRGTIVRYDIDQAVAYTANAAQATSARRRLSVVCDVEIIDQSTGKALWTGKGISAQGEYAENAEAAGRKQAVERLVNLVIEGAQSQW